RSGSSRKKKLHPRFAEHLKSRKIAGLGPLVVNLHGKRWTVDGLRRHLGKERTHLKIKDLQPHGLRKNAVIALLEAGATVHEVSAITGQTPQMVEHYAREVNQEVLADSAMAKWGGAEEP
ncbi:MAG: hypothetical protein O3B74_06500, partial [Proteobacteria bacterium]|nr:hypothetical protein [Pseudomonadota bacterium]